MTTMDGADHPLDYKVLAARYQRVLEVSRTISSTLDLPELLRRIVHAAAEVTETEAVSIMLYDSRSANCVLKQARLAVPLRWSASPFRLKAASPERSSRRRNRCSSPMSPKTLASFER